MNNRSYSGITRADVNQIRNELGAYGIKIPDGDNVEVAGPMGVKMQVTYDEAKQQLDLAITEKPNYITEEQIWKVVEMGAGRLGRSA